ncbi:discoidin domain-containing protein [Paenibacillus allorhizosphaerae]|uniref:discoidin domain-containing protein n=1 Tax=Paenibacillus allorhizosphaerae TaxID=2849866 RepID=UPI001C4052DB|nr:discoidin domain-containing protein [Paenibacillus allorhizosphaerae]
MIPASSVSAAGEEPPVSPAAIERPYFPPSESEKQTAVAKADVLLATYSEAQWLGLVPKQSPRTDGFSAPDGSDNDSWVWNPADPDHIMTQKGLVLPSDEYPYKYKQIKVMSGKTVDVAYIEYGGKQWYVQTRIDYEKTNFMMRNLPVIATAYLVTGDEKYARRVAMALDAWATAVPDFFMTGKNNATLISADNIADYYNTDIQRVSDHNGVAHEMHSGEIYAFDRIYNSQALIQLSQEKGYNVREHIQNDLFLNITEWLINYQSMKVHTVTNLSGAVDAIAKVAVLTKKPEYMEWLDQYLDITVGDNFKRDGMFPESFSYHSGYANTNYGIAVQVNYYFQVYQADTDFLRGLEQKIKSHLAFLAKAKEAQKTMAFPDGDLPPFDDTTKGGASKRTETHSQILPAYGHIMLGDGAGEQQTQLNLHFNDKANHVHPNVLSTALFGFGKELLGGIRYSRNAARNFTRSTLADNTVVVDGANQFRGNDQGAGNTGHLFTQGIVSLYEPGLNGIEASEVYSKLPYPGKVDRYQRMNILNTIDPAHPYLIDLFKVTGGSTHEYFLHGSTQFDETAQAGFPLQKIEKPYPLLPDNVTWTDPVKESDNRNWYGMFREVSTAKSPGNWDVTYRDANGGALGTRILMVDDGTNQVYLGKSPYSTRTSATSDNIYEYWRPSLIVKRGAEEQSNSSSNLAQGKTVTASSTWSASYSADKAVDGDEGTRWSAASGTSGNQWLTVDLGQPQAFNKVTIREYQSRITGYKIQYSNDGVSWNDAKTGTKSSGTTNTVTNVELDGTFTARYVRLLMAEASNTPTIFEFEIYNGSAVPNVPAAKLDSLFVSVIEPLNDESAIASIEKLPLQENNPEHLALSVKFKDGREDVVLVNLNAVGITGSTAADRPFATAGDGYALNGRIGIASKRSGGASTPYLIAGSSFRYGGDTLSMETPAYSGTITGAVRKAEGADVDALITPAPLPEGDALKGKWMSLNFGMYKVVPNSNGTYPSGIKEQQGMSEMFQIDRVERRGGLTYIVMASDHTLSIKDGKTSELLRPKRTFENVPTFRIDFSKVKDVVPPVTTATLEGTQRNGWYTDTVTVKLQASDNSTVTASTYYKLTVTDATYAAPSVTQSTYDPGSGWIPYTGPVAITRDGSFTFHYYSQDAEGNAEEEQTIDIRRDATGPVIRSAQPVENGSYADSKDLTIQLTIEDTVSGPDAGKTVVTLDGKPVQPGALIPLYTLPLGPHTLNVSAADLAGNTRSVAVPFTVETSRVSLQELVARFTANGWIDNGGISVSLQKKLENGQWNSFAGEVEAQRGKHIAEQAADVLLRDANRLSGQP